jgi:hypothetical protein
VRIVERKTVKPRYDSVVLELTMDELKALRNAVGKTSHAELNLYYTNMYQVRHSKLSSEGFKALHEALCLEVDANG